MKVTCGDAIFHSANAMQDIGGELEHLTMAEMADKDIVSRLTDAV